MIPGNANPLLLASAAEAAAAGPIKSLRFNSGDTAYLNKTFGSAGNRKTFTWSGWVKRAKLGTAQSIFTAGTNASTAYDTIEFASSDQIYIYSYNFPSFVYDLRTTQVFRDVSAWYHIVLSVDTTDSTANDRVKLYVNGVRIEDFSTNTTPSQNVDSAYWNTANPHYLGYSISRYPADCYLANVYFIDGSALDPTSFGAYDDSGVWQAAAYSGTFGTNGFHLLDFANESTVGHDSSGNNNDFTANNITGSLTNYSDDISIDSGNFYLDGRSGRFGFDGNSSTYIDCRLGTGSNSTTNIIWTPTGGIAGVTKIEVNSNYATHYRINEGTWTSFTSNGTTVEIYSGSSFTLTKLEIRRNNNGGSDFGHRVTFYEINNVEYIETNPSTLDVLFDAPTNDTTNTDSGLGGEISGNYCTLNPLKKSSEVTLSNGNLDLSTTSTSNKCKVFGTFGVSSGKWYYEVTIGTNHRGAVGWATSQDSNLAQAPGDSTGDYSLTFDTNKISSGSYTSGYGTAFFTGMVIGVRLDADAGTIAFSQNGTDKGNAFTGQTDKTFWPVVGDSSGGGTFDGVVNFGARSFVYSAPSGYKALCTTNLPTPTIEDGADYFDAKTYTGNGSTQSITGFQFSPDWVWYKDRGSTNGHALFDSVRGAQKRLRTMTSAAEVTDSTYLTSFDSDGFTVGSHVTGNTSGSSYIAWCWNVGANSNKTYTVTVVSDSGNKYRFDGHGTSAVTLDLAEGSTYVFDQSDSSNSGHPLRFSTTSDGTHNSGSEYTTGVTATGTPGSAGAKTTIVIPAGTTYSDDLTATSSGAYFATGAGAADAFDGNLNNSAQSEPNGSTITFSPTGGITVSTSLRVYRGSDSTSNTVNVSVNGGSAVTFARGSWVDLSFTGTLTSLAVSSPSANPGLSAIEVDGVVLEDNNSTPTLYYYCSSHSGMGGQANTNSTAGSTRLSSSENASFYNQDQDWSDGATGTTNGSDPISNLFDGSLSTSVNSTWGNASHKLEYTFTALPHTTIEMYVVGQNVNNSYVKFNGVAQQNGQSSVPFGWYTVTGVSGDLTSIEVYTHSSSDFLSIYAVRVDGKILVDSDKSISSLTQYPSINSVVKANPEAGFSIVTYSVPSSGSTFSVGHGLGAAPSLIIAKDRDGANPWGIYHSALGAGKGLLFSTAAEQVNSNWWNNTNPTSSVFYLNTGIYAHSQPGHDYVAYCISPVAGYSSVGSYTGNGSNDGPFIYTGHKVSWLMIKRTDSTSNWVIVDAARSSFNEVNDLLYAEQSLAETVDDGNNGIDFLSNGFKLRKGVGGTNVNGATLVYIAFASNPFQANGGLAR